MEFLRSFKKFATDFREDVRVSEDRSRDFQDVQKDSPIVQVQLTFRESKDFSESLENFSESSVNFLISPESLPRRPVNFLKI